MNPIEIAILDRLNRSGGGGSLPPVTSADDGKVMQVVNGEWAASDNIQSSDSYTDITKVKDYLYDIYYDAIDYKNAYDYFLTTEDPINIGACSSVRNGDFFGRNFDWIYNNDAEFVVHVPKIGNRHASIGIASSINGMTDEFVSSGAYSDKYPLIPFMVVDGINDCGVVANINVVPTDLGKNRVLPTEDSRVTICSRMLVRYILDYFDSATAAVDFIRKHMTIYFQKSLHDMDYEVHLMVADGSHTYLVEFINNSTVVTDMTDGSNSVLAGKPYMTNFYLNGVTLNDDGTVYTPETMDETHSAGETNGITDNGSGLERYNYIVEHYSFANTKSGMRALMSGLKYTKAYSTAGEVSDPYWFTEFVGINELTVNSPAADYDEVVEAAGQLYLDRSRDDEESTWQTVHNTVYDIKKKTLSVFVQESNDEFEYSIESKQQDGRHIYYQEDEPLDAEDNDIWIVKERIAEYLDYLYFRKPENAPDDLSACYVKLNYTDRSDLDIEYSFDKQNWESADLSAPYTIDLLEAGVDEVYFRGTNECIYGGSGWNSLFVCSCLVGTQEYGMDCGGNINTLLSYEHDIDTIPDNCFKRLFNDSNIISAPYFPASIVGAHAYGYMFYDCSLLKTPPKKISATKLTGYGSYEAMFQNCSSLLTAPELPAIDLSEGEGCYECMFLNCTSLVSGPSIIPAMYIPELCCNEMFEACSSLINPPELPATHVDTNGYNWMFVDCISLATAPALPAMTIGQGCYQLMFRGCTSLVTAPVLPATELGLNCYCDMFYGCISLINAPELPAMVLTNYCYADMFLGCSSLINAPALPATTLAEGCYKQMFQGCTSLVNAPELPSTILAEGCYEGMFLYCSSLVNAPALPATELAKNCYSDMFSQCTSLVVAPDLPATTLVNGCYGSTKYAFTQAGMFQGCTSLNSIKVSFTDWGTDNFATRYWLDGVAEIGTFTCPAALDTSVRDVHHVPAGWTIVTV